MLERPGLNRSTLRQRHTRPVAHDDVVQQADVNQRLTHALGDQLIGLTGFGHPRRVIVRDDDRRRVAGQCLLDDFLGVDARPVDRAAKQLVERDQRMAVLQVQAAIARQIYEAVLRLNMDGNDQFTVVLVEGISVSGTSTGGLVGWGNACASGNGGAAGLEILWRTSRIDFTD
jgi:hypothetical protein